MSRRAVSGRRVDEGNIAIVAGLPGCVPGQKDITTLGRGGSDTTAVALAAALDAEVCEIYTDVDGVFTADPRVVKKARKIDWISFEDMLELASSGSKVLLHRCVEYARRYNIPIHVRSSFSGLQGTWVSNETARGPAGGAGHHLRVSRTTPPRRRSRSSECRTSRARPRRSSAPSRTPRSTSTWSCRTSPRPSTGLTDISFTLPKTEGRKAIDALEKAEGRDRLRLAALRRPDRQDLARRRGHEDQPGRHRDVLRGAVRRGVNIELISTSEIRISVVTRADDVNEAVRAVHTAFGLDSDSDEAVVYGGTGR